MLFFLLLPFLFYCIAFKGYKIYKKTDKELTWNRKKEGLAYKYESNKKLFKGIVPFFLIG